MTIRIFMTTVLILSAAYVSAQESRPEGSVRTIDGRTVTALFDTGVIAGVGDEVAFVRSEDIVDPVTGNVRGRSTKTIGMGVVQDIGLGGVRINVTERSGGTEIAIGDRVVLTGAAKSISRPQEPRYGDIQEISNDRISTTLGIEDNISEGDIFLIQRTETTRDPDTDESAASEINIGRMSVESVGEGSSEGRIIEMKEQPLISDRVVRETDYLAFHESPAAQDNAEPAVSGSLQSQIDDMRREIDTLRSRLDNIAAEQERQRTDFGIMQRDIARVVDLFMAGDIPETIIRLKNDEPAAAEPANELMRRYEDALDACLTYRFDAAVEGFNAIMRDYPGSRLTENCLYWIAQSQYAMRRYSDAAPGFRAVLEDRRFTHKDDDAAIMLAVTYYQMGDTERAIEQFQRFLNNYPESEFTANVGYWVTLLSR